MLMIYLTFFFVLMYNFVHRLFYRFFILFHFILSHTNAKISTRKKKAAFCFVFFSADVMQSPCDQTQSIFQFFQSIQYKYKFFFCSSVDSPFNRLIWVGDLKWVIKKWMNKYILGWFMFKVICENKWLQFEHWAEDIIVISDILFIFCLVGDYDCHQHALLTYIHKYIYL